VFVYYKHIFFNFYSYNYRVFMVVGCIHRLVVKQWMLHNNVTFGRCQPSHTVLLAA